MYVCMLKIAYIMLKIEACYSSVITQSTICSNTNLVAKLISNSFKCKSDNESAGLKSGL